MKGSFSEGAGYLMRGAKLLKHPRLRAFVIVPLLINTVIFATLITLSINAVSSTLDGWMNAIPEWLSFLRWIIWPIIGIALALITGYLFSAVAIIIASPFNNLLAEKTEEIVTGREVQGPEGFAAAIASFPGAIMRELTKFAYYLPLLLLVVIATLIPGVNTLSPLLWFIFGAWMMSVQYVDYPMDNHQLGFGEVKQRCRSRRMTSLGFGGVVSLMAGIPILNFFVVPAAVCGATLYWCEELDSQRIELD